MVFGLIGEWLYGPFLQIGVQFYLSDFTVERDLPRFLANLIRLKPFKPFPLWYELWQKICQNYQNTSPRHIKLICKALSFLQPLF